MLVTPYQSQHLNMRRRKYYTKYIAHSPKPNANHPSHDSIDKDEGLPDNGVINLREVEDG